MAAVAELFEGDSDDPEEQRRRMEARQAAENIGALLALAILLTERVLRRRDSQAESEREKLRQAEPEHSSQAEEQSQAETDLDEPDWKEGMNRHLNCKQVSIPIKLAIIKRKGGGRAWGNSQYSQTNRRSRQRQRRYG